MFTKNNFTKLFLSAILLLLFVFQSNGQPFGGSFANGGFELTTPPPGPAAGSFLTFSNAGAIPLPPAPIIVNNWTVVVPPLFTQGNSVDLHHRGHLNMRGELRHHADLNQTGSIFQDITGLVPNTCYTVSFITRVHNDLNRNGIDSAIARVRVGPIGGIGTPFLDQTWELSVEAPVPPLTTRIAHVWQRMSFAFNTDASGSARLQFTGLTSSHTPPGGGIPWGGVMIDDIRFGIFPPCQEEVVKDTVTCNRYRFSVTNFSTIIHNVIWTVDGQNVHTGMNYEAVFAPGKHNVCAFYFGISRCDSNLICCNSDCDSLEVRRDTSKCIINRTVICGTNYDVDTSWRRSSCCTGTFTDSTDWTDAFTGDAVNHLFNDMRVSRTIRKTYTDANNCRVCIVTVNILIQKTEISGLTFINICPRQSFSFAALIAHLNSLGSNCNAMGVTDFTIASKTDTVVFNNMSPNYTFCVDSTYLITMSTNGVPACCFFRLTFMCAFSPGGNDEQDIQNQPLIQRLQNIDYMFMKPYKNYENPNSSIGANETPVDLIAVPNQSKGLFRIQQKRSSITVFDKVEITNTAGSVVYAREKMDANQQINIQEQASGVYFIKVTIGSNISTLKIIKE